MFAFKDAWFKLKGVLLKLSRDEKAVQDLLILWVELSLTNLTVYSASVTFRAVSNAVSVPPI